MAPDFLSQPIIDAVQVVYQLSVDRVEVVPADPIHGDFACSVAFGLAKSVGAAPLAIATKLAAALNHDEIAEAVATAPGYINIRMSETYWLNQLELITHDYGQNDAQLGRKIQVEFISANPTGPLTMANARGGYLGDVLSNVLATQGYHVTREYYINDAGNQIKKLADSIRFETGLPIEGERQYSGSYIADLARIIQPTLETKPELLEERANAEIISMIKTSVAKMGIKFDEWFSEKTLIDRGIVTEVLEKLKALELIYDKDSATWLASTKFGDDIFGFVFFWL